MNNNNYYLQDKNGAACPNIPYTNEMTEALRLQPKNDDTSKIMELFELCYFSLNTSQQGFFLDI